jgi:hypothetical protein
MMGEFSIDRILTTLQNNDRRSHCSRTQNKEETSRSRQVRPYYITKSEDTDAAKSSSSDDVDDAPHKLVGQPAALDYRLVLAKFVYVGTHLIKY